MSVRTTITFEPDVAARLARLRKKRDMGLKEAVNEAVRRGLDAMEAPEKPAERFEVRVFDTGGPPNDLVDVKKMLELLDEEYDRKKLGHRDPR